jgi:hypothetical protein
MTMNQAVQTIETTEPARESASLIQIIERAAANPAVDVDKMMKLLEMRERVEAAEAKKAYAAALAQLQPELPTIERNGMITITDKNDRNKIIQQTPYATWEDINEAIKPILGKHSFSLSFKPGQTPEGKITVTAILWHSAGHSEEAMLPLMHDSSGSKNSVQAIGSSLSYGKRYTACGLLNITSRAPGDADDDGTKAGAPGTINAEQVETLQKMIVDVDADLPRFLKFLGVSKIDDLPASKFGDAVHALKTKGARNG